MFHREHENVLRQGLSPREQRALLVDGINQQYYYFWLCALLRHLTIWLENNECLEASVLLNFHSRCLTWVGSSVTSAVVPVLYLKGGLSFMMEAIALLEIPRGLSSRPFLFTTIQSCLWFDHHMYFTSHLIYSTGQCGNSETRLPTSES